MTRGPQKGPKKGDFHGSSNLTSTNPSVYKGTPKFARPSAALILAQAQGPGPSNYMGGAKTVSNGQVRHVACKMHSRTASAHLDCNMTSCNHTTIQADGGGGMG